MEARARNTCGATPADRPLTDEEILEMIKSPPGSSSQRDVVIKALYQQRRFGVVQRAIEQGILDLYTRLPLRDNTLLHAAAELGSVNLIRFLFREHHIHVNAVDELGFTPLMCACARRQQEAALALLSEAPGIDVCWHPPDGPPPIHMAAVKGLVPVLRLLVAKGAPVNVDFQGAYPLSRTIEHNHEEATVFLLEEAGAAWNLGQSGVKIFDAIVEGKMLCALKALLRRMRADGVDFARGTMCEKVTEAIKEVSQGNVAMLAALVEGAELDMRRAVFFFVSSSDHMEPATSLLHIACSRGDQDVAAWLIDHGCDPLALDDAYQSACLCMPLVVKMK